MASFYGREFDATFRTLVKALECEFPVQLKTLPIKELEKLSEKFKYKEKSEGAYALCVFTWNNNVVESATIYIARNLPLLFAELLLVHELSHCLLPEDSKISHGVEWGKAYSKVYRLYVGEKETI